MKGIPSRRLIIGLTLFLLDSNSKLYSTYYDILNLRHTINSKLYSHSDSNISPTSKADAAGWMETQETSLSHNKNNNQHNVPWNAASIPKEQVVWFVDEDDICFGPLGFHSCGEINAWKLHHLEHENYWLEPYIDSASISGDVSPGHSNNNVVEHLSVHKRNHVDKPTPIMKIGSRKKLSYSIWKYKIDEGSLSIDIFESVDEGIERYCITRDHNSTGDEMTHNRIVQTKLVPCRHSKTRFEMVKFPTISKSKSIIRKSKSSFPISGVWECPDTKSLLPRSVMFPDSIRPQVFIDAGLYRKTVFGMNFKVFTLGWYMDHEAARSDNTLLQFKGLSTEQLESNSEFFDAVVSQNAQFDRSVLIKLSMTLKCEMMIQGLVDELPMASRNKELLIEANSRYPHKDCEKGLELLLTWRNGPLIRQGRIDQANSSFEIRVNNDLLAKIDEPSLGHDFMRHFVSEDPVTLFPPARVTLSNKFPKFLTHLSVTEEANLATQAGIDDGSDSNDQTLTPLAAIKQNALKIRQNVVSSLSKLRKIILRKNQFDKDNDSAMTQFREYDDYVNDMEYHNDILFKSSSHKRPAYYYTLSNSPTWNKIYGRIFEKVDKLEKIWHHFTRDSSKGSITRSSNFLSRRLTWTPWLHSLLCQQTPYHYKQNDARKQENVVKRRSRFRAFLYQYTGSSYAIETLLTLCVLSYFGILIMISLPPALLRKSARNFKKAVRKGIENSVVAVRAVRQTSIRQVRRAMQSTTSLASIVRSRSHESLFNGYQNQLDVLGVAGISRGNVGLSLE